MTRNPPYLGWLIALLFLKAILMVIWIQYSGLQLAPDEAQYWTWSRALDWGYYSKPPAIAWEIWLGTKLLGNTVLGVRIGAVVLSFLISLAVYYLALAAGLQERGAFWAGVISAFSPMGLFASYYATTDVGMVLFWTISCIILVHALHTKSAPNYLLFGLVVACGALFKWPIYLIWGVVIATWIPVSFFRSWSLLPGFLISLLGLMPSIIWNAERSWPTFQHVWSTILGGGGVPKKTALFQGNFFDFFGAQAALMSPFYFILLLAVFYLAAKHWKRVPLTMKFCGLMSFVILTAYQTASLFQKMQGNWCVFVFPTATVFLVWGLFNWREGRLYSGLGKHSVVGSPRDVHSSGALAMVSVNTDYRMFTGLGVSFCLIALILYIPLVQLNNWGPEISLKLNRFKECMGWNHIARGLQGINYDPETQFLASDTYQMSSLLSFYAPGQKRAYFLNLFGRRKNQFSYWPPLTANASGLFVVYQDMPQKEPQKQQLLKALEPYFDKVAYLQTSPLLYTHGKLRKAMMIFSCEGYNGRLPEETDTY